MTAAERRVCLELEHWFEMPVRGFYGWGFVDRNPARKLGSVRGELGAVKAARYMARNVSRYLGENASAESGDELPGRLMRSHVSVRLTLATGVTIRNLCRVRYLFVALREHLPLPDWSDAELQVVRRLLEEGVAAIRGP